MESKLESLQLRLQTLRKLSNGKSAIPEKSKRTACSQIAKGVNWPSVCGQQCGYQCGYPNGSLIAGFDRCKKKVPACFLQFLILFSILFSLGKIEQTKMCKFSNLFDFEILRTFGVRPYTRVLSEHSF